MEIKPLVKGGRLGSGGPAEVKVRELLGTHPIQVLRFVGETSPECLLQTGRPLNIPAPLPEVLSAPAESGLTEMVQHQREAETAYYSKHKCDHR